MTFRSRGFSLVEVLITVAITTVVMAGLVTTFAQVTKGVNNATRKTAQTNSVRGLSEMLRHDLSAAGSGVGDLRAYNTHFVLSEDVTGIDPGGSNADDLAPFFYGIDDLAYDVVNTKLFSSITLQWFDFDYTGTDSMPIFFASDYEWDAGGTYTGPMQLATNNENHLDNLESGDIMIFYKLRLMLEAGLYKDNVIWNAGLTDLDGNPDGEAIILQVATVTAGGTGGFSDLTYKGEVTFKSDGVFMNSFSQIDDRMKTMIEDNSGTLIGNLSDEGHPPKWAFVGRKLGGAGSFHRVRYHVEYATEMKAYVLLRSSNVGTTSYDEVVATDIYEFEIRLGLDVPVGTAPDAVLRADMDGYVSSADGTRWTMGTGTNPYGLPGWGSLTNDQYKMMIGRHALVADLLFTQQVDDVFEGGKVKRSFRQQIRLPNNNLPTASL